jgi:hypothetical protein
MIRFILLLFLTAQGAFAQNARAILRVVDEVEELNVGETYLFELTVVPFSTSSISEEVLRNKIFIDYFYVTKVESIVESENNIDAVVVRMKAILTKAFKIKPVYIWNLVDRNIPVEIESLHINDKKSVLSEFIIQQTGSSKPKSFIGIVVIFVGIVITLFGCIYWLRRKNRIKEAGLMPIKKIKENLYGARSHHDFETIYRNRNHYLELYKENEKLKRQFIELLDMYRVQQFSTAWPEQDLSEIITAKEKLVEGERLGT